MTAAHRLVALSLALLPLAVLSGCDGAAPTTTEEPPVVELNDPVEEAPNLEPVSGDSGLLAAPVGELPDHYKFVDETGTERTFADLRGRFVVLDFIFTSCSGPCPPMAEQMGKLQERVRDMDDVALLSISVDPRTDTPQVLADYAKSVGAEESTWDFARMPIGFVNELTREEFLVGDGGTPFAHTTKFILLDREGRSRAHYAPLVDPGWIDKLLADLVTLRAEKQQ